MVPVIASRLHSKLAYMKQRQADFFSKENELKLFFFNTHVFISNSLKMASQSSPNVRRFGWFLLVYISPNHNKIEIFWVFKSFNWRTRY